jgi:hypothetical protein
MEQDSDGATAAVGYRLPTLQQNILRKHFNRAEVSPGDVAALDYHKLMSIQGMGQKGMENIRLWLRSHGLDVQNPPSDDGTTRPQMRRGRIARAIALLRSKGFRIEKAGEDSA